MIGRASMLCLLVPVVACAQSPCKNDRIPASTPIADFENHDDGTVTDRRTGLMWSRCTLGQAGSLCAGAPTPLPWDLALQEADDALLAGYDDWRLPSRNELASLIEHCSFMPALNTDVFPNTSPAAFWTSTPFAGQHGLAWGVIFDNGETLPIDDTQGAYVRLVRTPQRVYAVGDQGPAGGIIVYDKGDASGGWRYLEVAPKAWAGGFDPWSTWGCDDTTVGTVETAIGAGVASTEALVNAGCSTPAKLADEAVINGYDDWFLPSRDELTAVYDALATTTNFRSDYGLQTMSYASSSELNAITAIAVDFGGGGYEVQVHKSLATLVVRPVRRF